MNHIQRTVLLADDENTLRKNLARVLEEEGFRVIACPDGTEALRVLKAEHVDAIITDLRMPGISGMDLIDHAKKLSPDASVIVITAFGEVETAVQAMKNGAEDYICKPLNFDELILRLKRLLLDKNLANENKLLREQIRRSADDDSVVGVSPQIKDVLKTVELVARNRANVLISGESGTGKEVLARAIHRSGAARDKPFVAVNCGGLPEHLIESELFGYRRGAFTGANTDRIGYFEAAAGGTLFLDEIGNLPERAQPVLLRAIEERAVTRVGDTRSRRVDIRIIAATNRDLMEAIEAGEFREDLYYRLNVVRIDVPPLRERREDVPPLIEFFVRKYNAELKCNCPGFTAEAIEILSHQPWRGNVRELENAIERALIFANDKEIDLTDLSGVVDVGPTVGAKTLALRDATRVFERRHIMSVLDSVDQNKVAAAERLGLGLSSLYRRIEDLGIGRTRRRAVGEKVE